MLILKQNADIKKQIAATANLIFLGSKLPAVGSVDKVLGGCPIKVYKEFETNPKNRDFFHAFDGWPDCAIFYEVVKQSNGHNVLTGGFGVGGINLETPGARAEISTWFTSLVYHNELMHGTLIVEDGDNMMLLQMCGYGLEQSGRYGEVWEGQLKAAIQYPPITVVIEEESENE